MKEVRTQLFGFVIPLADLDGFQDGLGHGQFSLAERGSMRAHGLRATARRRRVQLRLLNPVTTRADSAKKPPSSLGLTTMNRSRLQGVEYRPANRRCQETAVGKIVAPPLTGNTDAANAVTCCFSLPRSERISTPFECDDEHEHERDAGRIMR